MELYHANAAGNTFRILITETTQAAKKYLEILQLTGNWNFDSALVLLPSKVATYKMLVWEYDHTVSDMCGNGARAVGMLLRRLQQSPTIELLNGSVLHVEYGLNGRAQIPLSVVRSDKSLNQYMAQGEPHMVFRVPNVHTCGLEYWGSMVVRRYNVNCTVVHTNGPGVIHARTFERGVDHITQSCGTGASSAVQFCIDHNLASVRGVTEVCMHNNRLQVGHTLTNLVLSGDVEIIKIQ